MKNCKNPSHEKFDFGQFSLLFHTIVHFRLYTDHQGWGQAQVKLQVSWLEGKFRKTWSLLDSRMTWIANDLSLRRLRGRSLKGLNQAFPSHWCFCGHNVHTRSPAWENVFTHLHKWWCWFSRKRRLSDLSLYFQISLMFSLHLPSCENGCLFVLRNIIHL